MLDYGSFFFGAGVALLPCVGLFAWLFCRIDRIDFETSKLEERAEERHRAFLKELRQIIEQRQCICTDASARIYEGRKS